MSAKKIDGKAKAAEPELVEKTNTAAEAIEKAISEAQQ